MKAVLTLLELHDADRAADARCRSCIYFLAGGAAGESGSCRRRSPRPQFPLVRSDAACGDGAFKVEVPG